MRRTNPRPPQRAHGRPARLTRTSPPMPGKTRLARHPPARPFKHDRAADPRCRSPRLAADEDGCSRRGKMRASPFGREHSRVSRRPTVSAGRNDLGVGRGRRPLLTWVSGSRLSVGWARVRGRRTSGPAPCSVWAGAVPWGGPATAGALPLSVWHWRGVRDLRGGRISTVVFQGALVVSTRMWYSVGPRRPQIGHVTAGGAVPGSVGRVRGWHPASARIGRNPDSRGVASAGHAASIM